MLATQSSHDFELLKHESLAIEKFSRNGIQKETHVVAKGLPFHLDIASSSINFNNVRLYAKLHYDSDFDDDFKPVDYVKSEPMNYKVFISSTGDRVTFETRIYVLTSQHEDSLFRIKIGCIVGNNPPLEITTEPIRVVSKPSQIYKEKRKRAGAVTTVTPVAPPTPVPVLPITGKRKSTEADPVMETLRRLEENQREQRNMMENLLAKTTPSPAAPGSDLETALTMFLTAFNRLNAEERPEKVKKALSGLSPANSEGLTDFVTLCASPSIPFSSKMPLSLSQLLEDFPTENDGTSKKELEAWDNLYSELTWSPESSDQKEPELGQ